MIRPTGKNGPRYAARPSFLGGPEPVEPFHHKVVPYRSGRGRRSSPVMEKSLSQESPRTVTTMALITRGLPRWCPPFSQYGLEGWLPRPDVHKLSSGAVPREIPARLEALGVHGRHLLKGAHLPRRSVFPQLRHLRTGRASLPAGGCPGSHGPAPCRCGCRARYAPEGRGQGFGLRPPSGREGEIRLPEKPRFFVGQLGPAVTDKIECGHSLHPLR